MPIFEYRCQDCETRFETIVWRDSEKVECPDCGAQEVAKLISAFAVSTGSSGELAHETGPCHCGAPRRGMCGD